MVADSGIDSARIKCDNHVLDMLIFQPSPIFGAMMPPMLIVSFSYTISHSYCRFQIPILIGC